MKPVLLYDGDCGFCAYWAARWRTITGEAVEYLPFHERGHRFTSIDLDALNRAVHLAEADGRITRGAQAVFRLLSLGGGPRWLNWAYDHVRGFKSITERTYRFVADHRRQFSQVFRWRGVPRPGAHQYRLASWVFIRLLASVYFIAFASLGVQIVGLIGHNGILPVENLMAMAREKIAPADQWQLPTVLWWRTDDAFLTGCCNAGMIGSAIVFLGIAPALVLFLLWALYLSLCVGGQVFMNYQWDALLLETGLLAVLLAPWRLWPRRDREAPPPRWAVWLLWWLLFRLMFASGMVKLLSGDESWWNLTALTRHYETQPLPTWIGWYAHQLPTWLHQFCCGVMFLIELGAPFLMCLPGRLRIAACVSLIVLQLLIALTGNYTFFNLLTVALCLMLLNDSVWRRILPRRMTARLTALVPRSRAAWPHRLIAPPVALGLGLLGGAHLTAQLFGADRLPHTVARAMSTTGPFRSVNNYGLFANMTTDRPEIIFEGSDDGQNWQAYEFRYKPGDLRAAPGFVAPHQPRLDWQMWFAALGDPRSRPVVFNLMVRLLQGEPTILDLFDINPFPNAPPKYIRAVVYDYRFSDTTTRAASGDWWKREAKGAFAPPISLGE